MFLPEVQCRGTFAIGSTTVYRECVKVKKVYDEFVLRECVDGIEFEAEGCGENASFAIKPTLILRRCDIINPQISDASTKYLKRLRFSGRCCCHVYAKDENNNIIKLKVKSVPPGTALSKGPGGELCYSFNVRREYPGVKREAFERMLHFVDQQRFKLECMEEAIIDEENNQFVNGVLLTSLGIFLAVKFDAEVQLCIPVIGYCQLTDECSEEDFCGNFEAEDIPNFNPPQLSFIIPTTLEE